MVRRTPTPDELRAWRRFIETTDRVGAEIAARLQADSGLSPSDYSVLLALHEAPAHRLRPSALADAIGWERSRLSHHLARMERRALITREDCATDSRGSEIVLTDAGADAFRRSNPPHLRAIREVFVAALSPEQLGALDDAVAALGRRLDGIR